MLLISQSEYERLTKEPPTAKRSSEERLPLCEDKNQFQHTVSNNSEKALESITEPQSAVINKSAEILSPIDRLPPTEHLIKKVTKSTAANKKKKIIPRKKKPKGEENNSPLYSNLWETW